MQYSHILQAKYLQGDLKVPFPVKVRAAFAPQSLHSETVLPLIIDIPPSDIRHSHSSKQGNIFIFPKQPAGKKPVMCACEREIKEKVKSNKFNGEATNSFGFFIFRVEVSESVGVRVNNKM